VIKRDILICHDADELARKAAEQFVSLAGAAIARSGRFTVAAQVTFLIAGQNKRSVVNEILRSDADSFKYPAARVSPSDGQLTWLITADAVGNLPIRQKLQSRHDLELPAIYRQRSRRNGPGGATVGSPQQGDGQRLDEIRSLGDAHTPALLRWLA